MKLSAGSSTPRFPRLDSALPARLLPPARRPAVVFVEPPCIPQKGYRAIPAYGVRRGGPLQHSYLVQRLFSMFPRGWPGVALLLLRISVLSALLFQDYNHWQHLSVWLQSVAVLLSVALSAGYQTPVIAVLDILFHGLIWIRLGVGNVAEVTIVSLDAIALALLGPGAYSIDAYRFGRRVLVLPPP